MPQNISVSSRPDERTRRTIFGLIPRKASKSHYSLVRDAVHNHPPESNHPSDRKQAGDTRTQIAYVGMSEEYYFGSNQSATSRRYFCNVERRENAAYASGME